MVKTTWSEDYIYSKLRGRHANNWRRNKELEFEKKTGVRWVSEHVGGKFIFNPTWQHIDPSYYQRDYGVGRRVWESIGSNPLEITTFLKIHTKTHVSLVLLVSICKGWVKLGLLTPHIGRIGDYAIAVRKA